MRAPSIIVPTAVMSKDLRLRMRGWRWAGVATLYVAILASVVIGFLVQKYNPNDTGPSHVGIEFFQTLAIFELFLITFVTPASVAGAISGERQHRTWDLLVVSRLSTRQIVWGKLLASIAFNLVLLAASLPLFGLGFLFGGAALSDLVPVFVVFLFTILLLSSIGLVISALTARLTVSFMVSMLIALALTVGLSVLTLYQQSPGQVGILTVGGVAFNSGDTPSPLAPFAQCDPLMAVLSALPADGGGSLLGPVSTINHAFGLQWQLPLWGAYCLLSGLISLVLILAASRFAHARLGFAARPTRVPWQAVGGRR